MAKKILLADDSITIQKVIELTFSDEDFDVITVGNGRLALERLPEVRPDVVLCDIIMPEKDGYEVCEQIKSNPSLSHIPVLLLTGAFEPFDQERASRAGYDGSLAKPFEPETLVAKVKDLLARAPRPAAPTPSTPPVVPFVRPTAALPPPMPSMPPLPPLPPPVISGSFISDEPFPESEDPSSPPAPAPVSRPAVPPLATLSPEESESLAAPASSGHEADDSAATVMFRPADLPWANAPAAAPLSASGPSEAVVPAEAAILPDAPDGFGEAPPAGEPAAFEAVLEEDLDFGPGGFEPGPARDEPGGETLFSPEPPPAAAAAPVPAPALDVPPAYEAASSEFAEPASSIDDLVSGPEAPPEPEPSFVEEAVLAPPPAESTDAAETARVSESASAFAVFGRPPVEQAPPAAEPVAEPEPEPEPEPTPVAEAELAPPPSAPRPEPPAPPPAPEAVVPPAAADAFADIAPPVEALPPGPGSEAAAIPVAMDMVEKIAQRVVAQVSEKAVREIAWDVIPDLAEALIRQEIERLKAELQKT
jgi:CheY-like chemotaxis protein